MKFRIHLILAITVLLMLWFSIGNFGRSVRQQMVSSHVDLAAGGGYLFIVQDNLLKKLDDRLETVKAIPLPPGQQALPPEPNIGQIDITGDGANTNSGSGIEQMNVSPAGQTANHVAANRKYVYVYFQGVLYVFDYELNFIQSKHLE